MSVAIKAPWEGHTGYRTTLAWRYNGELQGDAVTLEEAVTKKKASACWEGSAAARSPCRSSSRRSGSAA